MNIAEGYLTPVWERCMQIGYSFPKHRVAEVQGPHGECWTNALLAQATGGGLIYCEGLAVHPRGRIGGGWVIRPRLLYPHAWCVDEEGVLVECTEGWTQLVERGDPATYVGVPVSNEITLRARTMIAAGLPGASSLELSVAANQS